MHFSWKNPKKSQNMKSNKEKMQELMDAAYCAGYGHTQSAFCKLVKIDPSNFSCMMNGKIPVTDAILRRVCIELTNLGVQIPQWELNVQPQSQQQPKEQSTDAYSDTFRIMINEMAAQREMYDRHISDLISILKETKRGYRRSPLRYVKQPRDLT